jgi:glyoxalase superfamily protein
MSGGAADTARVHFDILVEDLPAAHARIIAAGATLISRPVSPRPGPPAASQYPGASTATRPATRLPGRPLTGAANQAGRPFSR